MAFRQDQQQHRQKKETNYFFVDAAAGVSMLLLSSTNSTSSSIDTARPTTRTRRGRRIQGRRLHDGERNRRRASKLNGNYEKKKGWLNKCIRFDEFLVMLQYLSFAISKIPYMGVGRNLAYKKSLFFSVKGFASHIHIASGDDDLFIKEVATKNNVAIQFSESSETISEPKNKFKDWIYQRQRHISTSKHYKVNHKLLLFLFPFSTTLFWVIAAPLFIFHSDIILISSLFSFRILLYYFVYYRTMKKLRTFDLFYFYPIMEFLHLFVQIFFVLLNSRYKTNSWR